MRTKLYLAVFFSWVLLAGCMPDRRELPLPPQQPSLTPSITVPPLPTPTSWSTSTPLPPTPTPPLCWKTSGTLVEESVESVLLAEQIQMLIYLPPCYTQLTDLAYPALYLIHGQGFDMEQWVQLGVADLIDRWVATGDSPPLIVVLPEVSDWREPDDFPFGQALVEEVIPHIERSYRASPERTARKVGGISRGASWALHLGLMYWETFSAFGAHSLPVFYTDAPYLPGWLDAIPPDQRPHIYLDYAESDMSAIRRSTNRLIELLDERGYDYRFYTAPGVHDEAYWRDNLDQYLRFYLEGW